MLTGQEPPTPEQAEVMAMQQQMAIQKLQLEIAQLEADVKTQSDAAVNIAKVQDMTDVQPQMRLTELQTQIDAKREELQLRRDLAAVTNQTRMGQAETNAATRIAATAIQTAAKRPKQTDIPNFREP